MIKLAGSKVTEEHQEQLVIRFQEAEAALATMDLPEEVRRAMEQEKADVFKELLASYEPLLYKLARKAAWPRQEEDVEDAAQEARLQFILCARKWRSEEGCRFMTYLYPSVRGRLSKWWKDQTLIAIPTCRFHEHGGHRKISTNVSQAAHHAGESINVFESVVDYRPTAWDEEMRNAEQIEAKRQLEMLLERYGVSERNRKVLEGRLAGKTYDTLGREFGFTKQAAENACRRVYSQLGIEETTGITLSNEGRKRKEKMRRSEVELPRATGVNL